MVRNVVHILGNAFNYRSKRNQIIKKLSKYKFIVKTLLSIFEIIDGRVTVSDIKDLNIDDLLNREQVNQILNY